MKARAKSSNTPYPIWIQGDYITEPPVRPMDGAKRPVGHYIDKGGYPGANVYEVSIETLCRDTGAIDRRNRGIFESDILLFETEREIGYFTIQDTETAVDIINGEILGIGELQAQDIKVIGNMIDFPDFVEGIRHCIDTKREIPYLPTLGAMETPYPFLKMTCLKCGYVTLGCRYTAKHKDCGGYFTADFATKVYRKGGQKAEKVARFGPCMGY